MMMKRGFQIGVVMKQPPKEIPLGTQFGTLWENDKTTSLSTDYWHEHPTNSEDDELSLPSLDPHGYKEQCIVTMEKSGPFTWM
eukprot:3004971-Amphidinium_carterae.1